MKRRTSILLILILLLALLAVPAAAGNYGMVYDETDRINPEMLEFFGEEGMTSFSKLYGIEIRMDIVVGLGDYISVAELAEDWCEAYDYGATADGNVMTLTLLVTEDDTGLCLEDWYLYAGGDSWELTTNGPGSVYYSVEPWMTDKVWAGDLAEDENTVENAIYGFMNGLEQFVLAGGVAETIYAPVEKYEPPMDEIVPEPSEEPESPAEPEPTEENSEDIPENLPIYIWDLESLLSEEEWEALESAAEMTSETYDCGVYLITVDSYKNILPGGTIDEASKVAYRDLELGVGSEESGVLLLFSMDEREFWLAAHGYGNTVFTDNGKEYLSAEFLDNFKENQWYQGFTDYVETSGEMLQQARDGHPFNDKITTPFARVLGIAACALIALIISWLVVLFLEVQLESVEEETEASAYVSGPGVRITDSCDTYIRTTTSRKYDPKEKRSGRGSDTTVDRDGFSGKGGSF